MWREGEISEVERQPSCCSTLYPAILLPVWYPWATDTPTLSPWTDSWEGDDVKESPQCTNSEFFLCSWNTFSKKCSLLFCVPLSIQRHLGLILCLIMNIQYLIPDWVLGWLRSVLFFLQYLTELQNPLQKARTSPVLFTVFRFQWCYKDVIDLSSCLLFVMCFDQLLLFPQFKL